LKENYGRRNKSGIKQSGESARTSKSLIGKGSWGRLGEGVLLNYAAPVQKKKGSECERTKLPRRMDAVKGK